MQLLRCPCARADGIPAAPFSLRRRMGNEIHPTAVLDGEIELGEDNVIGPFSVLVGPLRVGSRNHIGPYASIGTPGDEIWQRRYDTAGKAVEIADDCTIREHVAIHKPVYGELTRVGAEVFLMHGSYVAHDTLVADRAVLAQNATIGGISQILEGAYVAMGAAVHQRAVIGHYAIVAAAAAAIRDVRPFTRFIPGRPTTVNNYAVKRYGFEEHRDEIVRYVHEGRPPQSERIGSMVAEYERLHAASERGQYA